jgi:hypothetical protein
MMARSVASWGWWMMKRFILAYDAGWDADMSEILWRRIGYARGIGQMSVICSEKSASR